MYNNSHPGIEFGDGVLKGPGTPGQVLRSVGNNEFSVVADAAHVPAGILKRADKDCAAQGTNDTTPCVVDMGDFVFQTDQFTGTPAAGTLLTFDATTAKLKAATAGTKIVAIVLSLDGSELTARWTNHGQVVPS
jgi:hypothetical protein